MDNKKRGRPHGSVVRENILSILQYVESVHGYELYKMYVSLFPKVSQRLIYYHLKRGVELEEIRVAKSVKEEGDYSWGSTVERTYYALGSATPRKSERIEHYLKIRKIKI